MKKLILLTLTVFTVACSIVPRAAAFQTPAPPEKKWLLQDEKNTIDIFNKAADSVVFVDTKTLVRDFFSRDIHEVPAGAGTGFLWDQVGYVVTNYHVIANSSTQTVNVRLRDGRSISAKIIGSDPRKDVAVLKLTDTKDLPQGFAERLAESNELQVGQKTIAIGNPFELSHTLTTGVISAINRTVPSPIRGFTNRDMVQTDAAINPGNSGGPLMDSRGYLIGMNSSIYSQSGNSAGVGFAVPANAIKRIVTQVIKTGKVSQPGLGIDVLPERFSQYLKIKGVIIRNIKAGSGAAKAGLKGSIINKKGEPEFGDVIVAIDGKKVEVLDDIYGILSDKNVGDKVTVDYLRAGTKKSTQLELINVQE